MKWIGLYATFVHIQAILGQENLLRIVRWVRWQMKMKWNESGFRPPLCTYRLNWARRTSWGWWDDWDDTVLQTQDSKFEPWRSEAEHATSRSRRLPTILSFTRGWGRNIFVSFKLLRQGNKPRTLGRICKDVEAGGQICLTWTRVVWYSGFKDTKMFLLWSLVNIVKSLRDLKVVCAALSLTARGSTIDVRIWRLQTPDSDVYSRPPHCKSKNRPIYNGRRPIIWVFKWSGKS